MKDLKSNSGLLSWKFISTKRGHQLSAKRGHPPPKHTATIDKPTVRKSVCFRLKTAQLSTEISPKRGSYPQFVTLIDSSGALIYKA